MNDHARRYRIGLRLFAGVVVVGAGVALIVWHFAASPPAPPSAVNYARSAAVRQADSAVATWQDRQFSVLQSQQRWLVPAGRSVLDACTATGGPGGLFGGGTQARVSCQRADTRYFTFGGTSASRRTELEQTLGLLGWEDFRPVAVTPGGTPLPVVSAQPAGPRTGVVGRATLEYSWAPGSQVVPEQDIGAVPTLTASARSAYLQVARVSQPEISRHLSPARDQVLIVMIMNNYASNPIG